MLTPAFVAQVLKMKQRDEDKGSSSEDDSSCQKSCSGACTFVFFVLIFLFQFIVKYVEWSSVDRTMNLTPTKTETIDQVLIVRNVG